MDFMMIHPSNLRGVIRMPSSKSFAHRAILCAILSKDLCQINNVTLNDDIIATIKSAFTLGAKCFYREGSLYIDSRDIFEVKNAIFDCEESGSTLRFLIPIVASAGISACFCGRGRLPERPIAPYLEVLPKFGVECKSEGGLPLKIRGKLMAGNFEIPGDISSQFVTGLLLALPTLKGDSRIILTSPLESRSYVDITVEVMKSFNVYVKKEDYGYYVPGNQRYHCNKYTVEDDWSQSAFWLVAGLLSKRSNNRLTISGLDINSSQGDKAIVDILKKMNGKIDVQKDYITAYPSELRGCEIDVTDTPDLLPAIAIAAMFADSKTHITGAGRLRLKESDRLLATAEGIHDLGGIANITEDSMYIEGIEYSDGGLVDGFDDHRIVMSMSVASVRTNSDIILSSYGCVNKSYPAFFSEFKKLGGEYDAF